MAMTSHLYAAAAAHSGHDAKPEVGAAVAGAISKYAPGIILCLVVTAAAFGLQAVEARVFGRAWLEALVLAILLGTAIRSVWTPSIHWQAGIDFSAKILLEIAVVLLGASVSAAALAAAGPALLIGIAAVVAVTILASYGVGRLFGLPHCMATLIACGNSICGNSAIAAVAPVIGAEGKDVAAAIGFTAVLGVGVVLGLPLLSVALHLTPRAFGVFAGLTVYAVPQVLAATTSVSALSAQVGTLVKLVRVLMLGPVVLVLSVIAARTCPDTEADAPKRAAKLPISRLVPWFIIGFLALMAARSAGAIPTAALPPMASAATWLTIVSMAALGLGVDVKVVAKAGPKAIGVVTLSLAILGAISFGLILLLGVR